jgi:hypothetical protein
LASATALTCTSITSSAAAVSKRAIVIREIDHGRSTHYFAVSDAIDAVVTLGPVLPTDEAERRRLLIPAVCASFKPWIPSQDELPAKVEERMNDVLDCLPKQQKPRPSTLIQPGRGYSVAPPNVTLAAGCKRGQRLVAHH